MVNLHRHCNVFFNVFSKSTAAIPHTQSEHLHTNQVTNDYTVQTHRALGEFIHTYLTLMWNSTYCATIPSWHTLVRFLRLVWTLNLYITVYKCMKNYGLEVKDWRRLFVNCWKFWMQTFTLHCENISAGQPFHSVDTFHKTWNSAPLWATYESQPIFHMPYCEDVACGVTVAKLAVKYSFYCIINSFLWLNWIAYDFLAWTYHQMLLPRSYLSDLKRTTYIEISGSFPQGLSVYISHEDYILLFVATFRVNITLISQPSTPLRQQKLLSSHCLGYGDTEIPTHCLHEGNDEKPVMFPLCHKGNNNSNKGFVKTPPV